MLRISSRINSERTPAYHLPNGICCQFPVGKVLSTEFSRKEPSIVGRLAQKKLIFHLTPFRLRSSEPPRWPWSFEYHFHGAAVSPKSALFVSSESRFLPFFRRQSALSRYRALSNPFPPPGAQTPPSEAWLHTESSFCVPVKLLAHAFALWKRLGKRISACFRLRWVSNPLTSP